MRKRIVVAAIAIVVIGVLAYVVSQPKKGSVEWHKREYLGTMDRAAERTQRDKVRRAFARISGTKPTKMSREERTALVQAMKQHENDLLHLGFLQKHEIRHVERGMFHSDEYFNPNGLSGSNSVSPYARSYVTETVTVVIGTAEDIPRLEDKVRKRAEIRRKRELAISEELLRQMGK